jgi:hypothetical protein
MNAAIQFAEILTIQGIASEAAEKLTNASSAVEERRFSAA